MIRCLFIQITRNQRGQAVRNERQISGDIITIGRAAESQIHLADHRANLHHAVMRHAEDGQLFIEADGATLNINGVFEQYGVLVPGTHILVGPYELVVEPSSGEYDLIVTCELVHPLLRADRSVAARAPMSLSAAGLSRRKPALLLAAIVLLVFFILPVAYTLNPAVHKALENLPLTPDESWNAGQMSPGHQALSGKCQTCHQQPFRQVPDQACVNCHKDVANHISDQALHAKVMGQVRCSDCHLDHRGRRGLVRHDPQQCIACHGNIRAKNPKTELSNVRDFSSAHPAFRLSLRVGPGDDDIKRVRQTNQDALIEKSGLKYSHKEHFNKALIEIPATDSVRDIQCDDCHKLDAAGAGFEPMTMAITCQQSKCHALNFNPREEGRKLPHASPQTVLTTLREFYAGRAISQKFAGGVTSGDLKRARNWSHAEADRNAKILFTETGEGTCLECHEITQSDDAAEPWIVAPVRVTGHWLPKARFPHAKHRTSKCKACHDVRNSERSSDVAIPTIAKCRECHVGSKKTRTRVSSTCDTCHGFHNVRGWQVLEEDEGQK